MIGILTFQFAHNYGAVLQAYALKKTIESMGTEVNIINYLPDGLYQTYSNNLLYYLRNRQLKSILKIHRKKYQVKKFKDFQNEFLELKYPIFNISDLTLEKYDTIIVGSDQVWNEKIVPDLSAYLLLDVEKVRKYSYAASFGSNTISENILPMVKNALSRFEMISIREQSGFNMVSNSCGLKAFCSVDPVLLLSAAEWRGFYKRKFSVESKEKYILYIDLYKDKKLMDRAEMLKQRTSLPILAIHPTCWDINQGKSHQLYDVGPLEYLKLIDEAEYIVSNSFHGIVFSYIFKKKLLYFFEGSTSSRITDFFNDIGIVDIENIIDFSNKEYSNSESILDSKKYIESILNR